MLRLVIFDLDGTLINAYNAIYKGLVYVLKKIDAPIPNLETVKKKVGWGEKSLLLNFIPEERLPDVIDLYRSKQKELLPSLAYLLPGVSETLNYLKDKGLKMAIASNRPSYTANLILKSLKIKDYFSVTFFEDSLKNRKPHPEMITKIMERLKTKAEETLYVGDMTIDAQTGKRAGVKTVIVLTCSSEREEVEKEEPYDIINSLSDLIPLIKTI